LSIDYVCPWKLVTLKPCDASDVLCDIELDNSEWGMGGGSNNLASGLEVGDNFAVRTKAENEKGADFYILKCWKTLHIVEVDVGLDDWQQSAEIGDEIVIGQYYKQGRSQTSFVLIRDQGPTFIYSHLVITSKFPMMQKSHRQKGDVTVYSLPQSTYEQTKAVLDDYNSSEDESGEEDDEDDSGQSS
jgi:hypothetical protein